ncbi:phosphatase PAP2 family protein [Falsiroseomonas oryzae]|uniref:hypothetical protein n=1 Tax=Falsiroseomonas oryzae TaxID=2766473 RepID=UPI0022EA4DEB|nr:hypothetical protein [Roseomonas sp. MO-31]
MRGHAINPAEASPRSPMPEPHRGLARRRLIGGAGLALGTALGAPVSPASGQATGQPLVTSPPAQPAATEPPVRPMDSTMRERAAAVREAAARQCGATPIAAHPANDDEARYPNRIGSDTRGLPHNARGEVDQDAWRAFFAACQSGDFADFERIPLGGQRKLFNPVGTLAVSPRGLTPTQVGIPAAPALASAERAAETVEVYWQSLLRDVPLSEFQDDTAHREIRAATEELSRLQEFHGAKRGGRVTPGTLFRATACYMDGANPRGRVVVPVGVLDGPVVSQFLYRDVPLAAQWMDARMRTVTPENEFLTDPDEWLAIQNGQPPRRRLTFDATPRYIATGRDLAEYVHSGPPMALAAAMLLATPVGGADPRYSGLFPLAQPALSDTNPYRRSRTQTAATPTFGLAQVSAMLADAVPTAIRAAYWQKYFVHRTLRPEAYGGLAHQRLANGVSDYPLHDDFLRSEALDRSKSKHGTFLLSHTYPEGAALHSAYPGGGAALGAVVATILKAFFDESRVISDPVQPDPRDPTRLVPWSGPPLTVGGELNKMGSNYAMGRDWSGIHWRSDAATAMVIGEEVAISMLRDERATFREPFDGFSFTRFDGTRVTI